MKIPDYHIHTKLCKHARGEMHEYVESAIEKGFAEIAFTDHIPLPNQFDLAHRMAEVELELYVDQINKLNASYPEIRIKCGIEADYYEGFEDYLYHIFQYFDFDLTIMSVHFVKGWPDNNWAFSYHFPGRSFSEIYHDYLDALQKGIKSGLFDIIGHFDLVKTENESLLKHNARDVEDTLQLAAMQNMAIEINTSGLRREIKETYPDLSLIPLIQKYEIPLTLGSDAHHPGEVGFQFNKVAEQLDDSHKPVFARF